MPRPTFKVFCISRDIKFSNYRPNNNCKYIFSKYLYNTNCNGDIRSNLSIRKCHTQAQSMLRHDSTVSPGDSSNRPIIKKKIDELVVKYEQITGLDEVRKAQNRVIEAQDRFVIVQEKRREIVKELTTIQNKLKEVYADLDATTRGEERYLTLVTKEHSLLKEERKLTAEFNLTEREERECFTFLSSSVKESHEKERAQAERTKYWSVIGSIVGTVIGVVGSSINNEFKMRELRKLVRESVAHSQKSTEVDSMAAAVLSRHEQQLNEIVNEIRTINASHQSTSSSTLSKLIHDIDHPVGYAPIEDFLEEQKRETRFMLGFAIIVIPIIVACMNRLL